jgi:hypothetical protein
MAGREDVLAEELAAFAQLRCVAVEQDRVGRQLAAALAGVAGRTPIPPSTSNRASDSVAPVRADARTARAGAHAGTG